MQKTTGSTFGKDKYFSRKRQVKQINSARVKICSKIFLWFARILYFCVLFLYKIFRMGHKVE